MFKLVIVLFLAGAVYGKYEEKLLVKQLLSNYENYGVDGRPVEEAGQSVPLKFGLALMNILDFDVEHERATFHVWHKTGWKDPLLTWNPQEHSGITQVRIPVSKIWRPDIKLYNGAFSEPDSSDDILAVVQNDGSVIFIPPMRQTGTCKAASKNTMTCELVYGLWSYDTGKVDMQFDEGEHKADVSYFHGAHKYEITENTAVRNVKKYDCCPEQYADITYTLTIKTK